MAGSISRRDLVIGAGVGALAHGTGVPLATAEARTSDAVLQVAGFERFDEVWPESLEKHLQNAPKCGYSRAARIIFTVAKEYVAKYGKNEDSYERAQGFALTRIAEQGFDPKPDPFLPQVDTHPHGRRFFIDMWSKGNKPGKKRARGLRSLAVRAALLGSSPEATGNGENQWYRRCEDAVEDGAEGQDEQRQQGPSTTRSRGGGLTDPEQEEIAEVIDSLP